MSGVVKDHPKKQVEAISIVGEDGFISKLARRGTPSQKGFLNQCAVGDFSKRGTETQEEAEMHEAEGF